MIESSIEVGGKPLPFLFQDAQGAQAVVESSGTVKNGDSTQEGDKNPYQDAIVVVAVLGALGLALVVRNWINELIGLNEPRHW